MADLLIHSPVPSLFNHTESASNLIVNTPATEDSHTNTKLNGHSTRSRHGFTENSSTSYHFDSNRSSLSIADDHTANFHKTREIFEKPMTNNTQNIPIQFISTSVNRSFTANEDVPQTILNRNYSNLEQHYDFPADAIEQLKKKQSDEHDTTDHTSKSSNEQTTARIFPSFLPTNVLKRMDHLNTVFVKPTKIGHVLPKLVFQDVEKHEESRSVETPTLNAPDYIQSDDQSSSPLFYEKPGIPELDHDDDDDETLKRPRRVKFSTAPIRVYLTYSPNEYDRRNDDVDPFAASAEYELEKRIEKMEIFNVEVEKGPDGLGISVLGMGVGADSGLEKLGIFVKTLNPQGPVAKDGRIQVGDQIIEVNDHSLVGVSHSYATNILKGTSGLVTFLIGREKEIEKSEILSLIQRSLQLDQEHEQMTQTFQQYHDAYYERTFTDEDDEEDDGLTKEDEKISNKFEIEILKECYESLEKTLDTTEKEKEQYQLLYQQAQNDLKQIEEKYNLAKILIKQLQERESDLCQRQTESSEQQEKYINELMKKVEELEKIIASSNTKPENNSSFKTTEYIVSHPPDIPERMLNSVKQLISTNRSAIPASTDRLSSPSQHDQASWQIHTTSNNYKSSDHLDTTVDQNSLMSKPHGIKTYSRDIPSKHLSTPSLVEIRNNSDTINAKTSLSKVPSLELTNKSDFSTDKYIEIRDWTLDQCIQWLTAQELTALIPIFLNRSINGEKLLVLDSAKMKAMGIKSSKDRDQLKTKIKELKQVELGRLRERILREPPFQRALPSGNRLRSSSLTKLRERKFFGGSGGK